MGLMASMAQSQQEWPSVEVEGHTVKTWGEALLGLLVWGQMSPYLGIAGQNTWLRISESG